MVSSCALPLILPLPRAGSHVFGMQLKPLIQVFEESNARQYGSVSIGEFYKGSMYDLEVPAMWMPLFFLTKGLHQELPVASHSGTSFQNITYIQCPE